MIVVVKPEAGLRVTKEGVASAAGIDIASLTDLLSTEGAVLKPLFGVGEARLKEEASSLSAATGAEVPDLSVYYKVEAPDDRLDRLAERLRQLEVVEAAYVKPPAELPEINDMLPLAEEPPVHTPDFTPRQGYLEAAPGGIDARYAWTLPGGGGAGVSVVDIEGAWRFSHEDLGQNQGGVIGGAPIDDPAWRNHGTAAVGVFGGDRNPLGIMGICPDANVRAVSIGGLGSAAAIRQAANVLQPGDLLLIELHRPGPRATGVGQQGFIPIEWWPDDFDAIRFATRRGVIVVEAAGNGSENLNDPIYNTPPAGFPAVWTNPFQRANRDSGAIVVGAGAPPPATHSRDHGPDRSRLDFSNWGELIDAQGWGREVTTCGYGDLQGGMNEDEWYTDRFSGTSSASPIVVGALGCVQGVLRARRRSPLTPAEARNLLRSAGSPQQDAPGRPSTERIGHRPDLRQMIPRAKGKDSKEIKEKERKEFKDLPKEKEKDKEIKEAKEQKEKEKEVKEKEKEFKEFKEKDRKEFKDLPKEKDKDLREGFRFQPGISVRPLPGGFFEARLARLEAALAEMSALIRKAIKEKEKEIREDFSTGPIDALPLERRLARMEAAVDRLAHFIGPELRPDLGAGALGREPNLGGSDPAALRRQLQKQASDAKQAKDGKDAEKLKEG